MERRFRRMVDDAPVCVAMIRDMRYAYTNRAHAVAFGFDDPLDVLGTEVAARIAPESFERLLASLVGAGEPSAGSLPYEVSAIRRDGSRFPFLVATVTTGDANEPTFLSFGMDLGAYRREGDRAAFIEKMRMAGGLAAGMARKINNAAAVVAHGIHAVERRFSPDLRQNRELATELGLDLDAVAAYIERRGIRRLIRDVEAAAGGAGAVVSSMLEFGEGGGSARVSSDLAEILERALARAAVDPACREDGRLDAVSIARVAGGRLPAVCVDPTAVERSILEMLRNAAQAMAAAGTEAPEIRLRLFPEGGYACLELSDNGPGIPQALRERVFEPFFSGAGEGGGGLGLTVAYAVVVRQHGGAIEVDAAPGGGARFTLRLPGACGGAP